MFVVPAFAVLLLMLAGCVQRLPEGRYSVEGHNDFILVSNDLMFLHVSTPEENPSPLAYWNWAGSYSLSKDGTLKPDMDTEVWKTWNFYYSFVYEKNTVKIINKSSGCPSLTLYLNTPMRRKNLQY